MRRRHDSHSCCVQGLIKHRVARVMLAHLMSGETFYKVQSSTYIYLRPIAVKCLLYSSIRPNRFFASCIYLCTVRDSFTIRHVKLRINNLLVSIHVGYDLNIFLFYSLVLKGFKSVSIFCVWEWRIHDINN